MVNDSLTRTPEKTVAGTYRLGAVLHRSAVGAIHETEFGDDGQPAAIKIRRGDTPEAEEQLARWHNAIDLAHPNLLRVFDAGSSVLYGAPIIYVVMERADESLEGVLAERALSEDETRELLEPALGALIYLHKNGYAHAGLKSSNILAIGDKIKLSSDSVTRVSDGGSPAGDIYALGGVIVQALTQQWPLLDEDAGPYILRESSQTFTDIVRHCLESDPSRRWNVNEIEARLNAKATPPVISRPDNVVPIAGGPLPVARPRPVQEEEEEESSKASDRDDAPRAKNSPVWLYWALAAAVLIAVLMAFARYEDSGTTAATAARPAQASRPAIDTKAPPLPPAPASGSAELFVPEVKTPQPSAKVTPPAPAPHGSRGRKEDGWAVIVAAYTARGPAEKRQTEMARRWSKFNLGVLQQQADKAYYLVTLGQNLSENEADALRKRAISSGLPRDTYIKRLP
jgi:serine/threonine protein kinase